MTANLTRKEKISKSQSGFSLIELMITVAIIGIIAAIAIPVYKNYVSAARYSKAQAMLMQLPVLMEQYRAESLTGNLCPQADLPCSTASGGAGEYTELTGTAEISAATYLSSFDPVLEADGVDYLYKINFDTSDNATLTVELQRSGTTFDTVTCYFPSGDCD